MPLGIDATIRYRLNNWSRPLTNGDLRGAGAYNTRLHTGLPPTPIGNPGLSSIQAAAHPARKPYLFYVVKPCGNGAHAFSSTDAQFQRDVAAYNRARAAAGGKAVVVMGGGDVIRQCLDAGVLHELRIHLSPIVLGGGTPLLAGSDRHELVQRSVRVSANATHLVYEVL
jgi:hypothetical protein